MKKLIFTIFLFSILLQSNAKGIEGVKIQGIVKNSNEEYVVLSYEPRYRGNLNYDGLFSIGTRIDKKGSFVLHSEKISHSSYYTMHIKDKALRLILFNGDNLKLEFDLNNIDSSLLVLGKGAGKINVLNLQQFDSDLMFNTKYTLDIYRIRVDSVINAQLALLESIYMKDLNNETISKAINKKAISNIIVQTPLSEIEYDFLKRKISIKKYTLGVFPSYLCENNLTDSVEVDFSSIYFNCFNEQEYKKIDNINCWEFEGSLDDILHIEYLRSIQKSATPVTYRNWNSNFKNYTKYNDWIALYLKQNFNTNVFDKYYADQLSWDLTLGSSSDESYKQFIKNCSNNKYLNRINNFKNLLENGLQNTDYNLSASQFALTPTKLDSLLKSFKGKPVYLVIWSAQFAGSTVIPKLPSIIDFEKENLGKIEVVNICIDKANFKDLWAARIIDNSWRGHHYFLPSEGNDSIINMFDAKKIFAFCYDGATYTLIDKDGNLVNGVDAPIMLTKDSLTKNITPNR
jgi:hypothetical protein